MSTSMKPQFGGTIEVVPRASHRPSDAVVSHTDDGRTVMWHSPPVATGRRAVDVERPRKTVPEAASRAVGLTGHSCPWTAWTLLETEAKLCDVPVLRLLKGAESRPTGPMWFESLWLGSLRCTLGVIPSLADDWWATRSEVLELEWAAPQRIETASVA